MKNRKLIFQDQNHERIARDQIKQSQEVMQQLADRYHKIAKANNLPELSDSNLQEFWSDIETFVKAHLENNVLVPAGLNRDKYLSLVDMPQVDVTVLQELYNQIAIKDVSLFSIVSGKVYINEARASEHVNAGNYFIESGTRKEAAYTAIQKLCAALNELRASTTGHQPFSTSFGFQADALFTRQWDAGLHSTVYTVDKQKTMNYLSRVLE